MTTQLAYEDGIRGGVFKPRSLLMALAAAGILLLAGCATVDIKQSVARTNLEARDLTGGKLSFAQSDAERAELQNSANAPLTKPLARDDAVHLALINSPAMQAILAQSWAEAAVALQAGRLPNPVLTLERFRTPSETEIGRMLAFGLLDLLTLPATAPDGKRKGRASAVAIDCRRR